MGKLKRRILRKEEKKKLWEKKKGTRSREVVEKIVREFNSMNIHDFLIILEQSCIGVALVYVSMYCILGLCLFSFIGKILIY